MKDKIAVLRLAGYEVRKVTRPAHLPTWDWNLFDQNTWVSSGTEYFRTKAECVRDALDDLIQSHQNNL